MAKKINELHWNLDDVLKKEDFEKLLKELEREIEKTEEWWKKLDRNMKLEDFKAFLEYDEAVGKKFLRLGYLPELMESLNQKDNEARLMKTKGADLALKFSQKTRKISHWIKGLEVEGKEKLDEENAKRLFKAIPALEYGLTYSRQAAKHTLSQKEEEIIDNKDVNVGSAVSDLRGLIEAEMVYNFGKRKIKTQGELLKYVHDKSAKKREMAYRSLLTKQKEHIDKLFVIYQAVVKDWVYESKLRGYSSSIGMRNFGNHVPDKAIETLLRVCREEKGVYHEFFKFKAKELRKKKLSRFDLYAPLSSKVNKVHKVIKLEEAKKLVLDSFAKFSPKFVEFTNEIFDKQHIDSHPRANKRSGAFCATVSPKIPPYILLNHTNTLRDVSTLAHELGHGIHSMYARHLPASAQHANLPLSETASTLGEMLLFEKMVKEESDPGIKKMLLAEKINDSYATILRQNYFVLFELEAHQRIAEGTTAKELCKIYLKNLKEQFGNSVKVDPIFRYEWLYIAHIFESPFYCYAYNFGELLSMSLYAQYKAAGESFVPKIEKLLTAGGSEDPNLLLRQIGVNIEDPDFWRGAFEIVRGWQRDLFRL